LAPLLIAHAVCQSELALEAALERGVARNLAVDVADHAAEPGAQKAHLASVAPELREVTQRRECTRTEHKRCSLTECRRS
jgi:hypothetical protein